MKLQHKPGVANKVADALSKAPLPDDKNFSVKDRVLQVSEQDLEPSQVVLQQVQKQQMKDPELAKLMVYLKTKTLPEDPQEAKVIGNLARKGYFVGCK